MQHTRSNDRRCSLLFDELPAEGMSPGGGKWHWTMSLRRGCDKARILTEIRRFGDWGWWLKQTPRYGTPGNPPAFPHIFADCAPDDMTRSLRLNELRQGGTPSRRAIVKCPVIPANPAACGSCRRSDQVDLHDYQHDNHCRPFPHD